MIQESYVTFQQAKALKELGFPQEGHLSYYLNEGARIAQATLKTYAKVTLSLVQKWLREEKKIDLLIYDWDLCNDEVDLYFAVIRNRNQPYIENMQQDDIAESHIRYPWESKMYDSYEQALSLGIDKCIEILNHKQNGSLDD